MENVLIATAGAEPSNVIPFAGAHFLSEPAGALGAAIDALRCGAIKQRRNLTPIWSAPLRVDRVRLLF